MEKTELHEKLENDIKSTLKSGDEISVSLIQRKFKTGYNLASKVFNSLAEEGFINVAKNHPLGVSRIK